MKRIQDLLNRELTWTQPRAMKREYELGDGDETVATLRFRSALGSLAFLETADGAWSFKRVGFWRTRVIVCPRDSEQEIATFHNNTWSGGGTLELAGGRSLRANTNFWMSKYEFIDSTDQPVVHFHRFKGVFHHSSRVDITPSGATLPELPWLVGLGWYLAIKMQDDAAGASAAATAG